MNDIRFALRQLAKAPGFTLVALLTLAIGIGACTAIFSIVNSVLLRPLSYPHPEELVSIRESDPPDLPVFSVSPGNYSDWRKQATSFAQMAAANFDAFNITGTGDPIRVYGQRVTLNYLATMGVQPALGRDFLPGEDTAGRSDVAIISDDFWASQFARRPDVIGQVLHLNGAPVTVIGVMPWSFHGATLMVPMVLTPADIANHGGHYMGATGRLKPGVTPAQAFGELKVIAAGLAAKYPDSNKGWTVIVKPLLEDKVGRIRPQLLSLLAAVGFLLFIGCANVANLLLVRASARAREMAIRSAVGASRGRIVRQLIAENLVLALLGGVCGTLLAYWGLHILLTLAPYGVPRSSEISIDHWALAFCFVLSLATGIGFGLVPALQAARVDLNTVLKDAGRGTSEGRRTHRLRDGLVIAELMIAVVLLVGAGLLMRSFIRLEHVDPGFHAESAVVVDLSLPDKKYPDPAHTAAFARQACDAMAAIPGVTSVGVSQALPFDNDYVLEFDIEEHHKPASDQPSANYYAVSPGYFKAMGIPLIRGRLFTESDTAGSHLVTIVSQGMASRFFPGEDPIGKRINIAGAAGTWSEIVGIVGDVKQYDLASPSPAANYEAFAQHAFNFQTFVVRTDGDTASLAAAIRAAVKSIDHDQPVQDVRPLADLLKGSISTQHFAMNLFIVFSAAALLLATLGIYGVMAYSVNQRTSEIGVRMALGAQGRDVLRMIALQGMKLIAIGIVGGLVGSLILTRFISSMLFGVGSADPLTMACACIVLAGAALAACMLSAFRATRIEPVVALRGD
jgi:putative ABC transport system permease protein